MSDNKVVLLSDVLPTAWHANELGGVGKGDRVAIWGAGPGMISPSPADETFMLLGMSPQSP